jgi:hypothetical protein
MIVKSQEIKNTLLTALADEEMVKIMNCVMNLPNLLTIFSRE